MSIGEIVSALSRYCADGDYLLFVKSVWSIEVNNDMIDIVFVDGNTTNVRIDVNGNLVEYI